MTANLDILLWGEVKELLPRQDAKGEFQIVKLVQGPDDETPFLLIFLAKGIESQFVLSPGDRVLITVRDAQTVYEDELRRGG